MPVVDPKITALNVILDRVLRKLPSGDGPEVAHFRQVTSPIGDVTAGALALHKLHANRNPTDTDAAHFRKVASSAKKLAYQIEQSEHAIKVAKQNADADLYNRTTATLNLKPDAYAQEVRMVYRSKSPQERRK